MWASLTTGDRDIIVAVVDEGVCYTHPDLAANIWVNEAEKNGLPDVDDDNNGYIDDIYGWNFVENGNVSWGKEGDTGHGTHCSGSIAAVNNNGVGVSGVAGGSGQKDGVRIMSCQVFSGKAGGKTAITSRAITYAADNGASVISCSWGYNAGVFMSDTEYRNGNGKANEMEYGAIKYFEASVNNCVLDGNVAVFSAGNDAKNFSNYPGALSDIISVSSFGPDYLPAYYTNYGPGCNIVAPGGDYYLKPYNNKSAILSTLPEANSNNTGYGYMQGTSMACPHVSGVVALALSYAKKLGKTFGREEFKQMVVTSANDFDTRLMGTKKGPTSEINLVDYQKQMGTGSIDAWKLMMKIEGIPSQIVSTGSNQGIDISPYFGTSSTNLTYLGIEVLGDGAEALGLAQEPYIKYGRLYIHPTKPGACRIKINAIGGGTTTGGESTIGGMECSQTVSIIARPFSNKEGGWL